MAHERKCIVCETSYSYCPRCRQYASSPQWKINFCSEECKEVYDTVDKFVFKHISADDAKKILSNSKVNIKNNEIKKTIDSILASEDKKNKKKNNEIVNED